MKGKYFDNWYVICTSEQSLFLTKMCDHATTRNLFWKRSRTEKEKEEKVRKQRYTMTFPTKEEVNFALRFETFDLPPYGKESSCNFRNILEGYVSTKTGYRLPNVHTLHNQVHIVVGGAMGDVSSASNDPIFPFIIFLWIVFMRNGFTSSTRTLRFFQPTMHPRDTTKMTQRVAFSRVG